MRGWYCWVKTCPTSVEAPVSVFYRIVDGRIVEFRGQLDMMILMEQLGVIASPQQAEV
jgi:hypothetical protein